MSCVGEQIARQWVEQQIEIERLNRRITELLVANNAEVERRRTAEVRVTCLTKAAAKTNEEICQVLGRALGYPVLADDQRNFPGATAADGVCVGDHVAESIADEAARFIQTHRLASGVGSVATHG